MWALGPKKKKKKNGASLQIATTFRVVSKSNKLRNCSILCRLSLRLDKCYIQFIETNDYITFGTAIAAFYAPVTVMCVLYWRVWRTTENRQKDLSNLQAGKKNDSHRSNSRYVSRPPPPPPPSFAKFKRKMRRLAH